MAEHTGTANRGIPFFENREGDDRYNIRREHWKGRPFGLSAMLRARDEAAWLSASIASAIDWHDEILIILQGEQSDGTDRIARDWEARHPKKVRVVEYPWIIRQHENYRARASSLTDSLHERAYYKNWCLSQTRFSYAHKWDGDMVALAGLGSAVRQLLDQRAAAIRYEGLNLVGADLKMISVKARAVAETRIYRVTPGVFFRPGNRCQQLVCEHSPVVLTGPQYLHLKWCKTQDSATKAWPLNWQGHEAYRRYRAYATPGRPYPGPIPLAIRVWGGK